MHPSMSSGAASRNANAVSYELAVNPADRNNRSIDRRKAASSSTM
jgi:hypothetical protein